MEELSALLKNTRYPGRGKTGEDLPTPQDAEQIAHKVLGTRIVSATRMPTGVCNWVYEVVPATGPHVVVRIHRSHGEYASGVYWSRTLRALGVPLPEMLAHYAGSGDDRSWTVLQRLPGTDLQDVHWALTPSQRCDVADGVVDAQQKVTNGIEQGGGFGYVRWPRDWPARTWGDVIRLDLSIWRQRIVRAGVVDPRHVDRVESLLSRFEDYLAQVQPIPFLEDTTTKNVIVHEGRLSGIVDVDNICYGDVLYIVGLTQMALLKMNQGTDYTDHWLNRLNAAEEQRRVVSFYTAVFCINFLAEQGQLYNRATPVPVDPREVEQLESILDQLRREIDS